MPFQFNPFRLLPFLFPMLISYGSEAQQGSDTVSATLPEVSIRAFDQNRRLREVPAAVNLVTQQTLSRFSPTSIVQAVNTIPGVRMEERSPGSYRFNIRGSALRSPFGVRNVKVYFNDLPITDPGGHTYLNQLGYYNFNSIEIIKGPGSSLYGAGTGGVLLIESLGRQEEPGAFAEYAAGSFGMRNAYGSITTGTEAALSRVGYQRQESEGYRDHSALRRDVLSWTGRFRIDERRQLKTSFLYGDLFYETPGALTEAEYRNNPRAARPGGFGFPGSEAAQASIRQRTFLAGASYDQRWNDTWSSESALYGMFTELRNPTIRNYGRSSEPHVGGRSQIHFRRSASALRVHGTLGSEWQRGFTSVAIYKNAQGQPDSLQSNDDVHNRLAFLFSQWSLDFKGWQLMAGASINSLKVSFQRFQPATAGRQVRSINNQWAPRLALSRQWTPGPFQLLVYTSLSRGFSPPTTAELLPTGGGINFGLNPEEGTNVDLGIKGTFWRGLFIDVNAFRFSLENTIVQRRDAGGGDFFVNAGQTKQYGIETLVQLPLLQRSMNYRSSLFWLSHTWHRFRYESFRQLNADFSGKRLPGVAPHTLAAGIDLQAQKGWLGTISYLYSDRTPLNDANSVYANAFHVVGLKAGYQLRVRDAWRWKLVAGVDNLLDENYSLGNDVNGFGGRFFNAAPGRNYYVALLGQWYKGKR